jgi:hypothetical protein
MYANTTCACPVGDMVRVGHGIVVERVFAVPERDTQRSGGGCGALTADAASIPEGVWSVWVLGTTGIEDCASACFEEPPWYDARSS